MAEFEPFKLLSLNHVGSVFFCLLIIVFVPRFFVGVSDKTLRLLGFGLVLLILHLQVLELYVFTQLYGREWKEILPLQLCDFAAWAIVVYFIWGYKFAFNCAYFWGVSGAGMAILTPNAHFAFPSPDYLVHQYGHVIVLLGVSIAMTLCRARPFQEDIAKVFSFTAACLLPVYGINYVLGPPANYWFLNHKPSGENVMQWLPPEPFHTAALIPMTLFFCVVVYLPFYLTDRFLSNRHHHRKHH